MSIALMFLNKLFSTWHALFLYFMFGWYLVCIFVLYHCMIVLWVSRWAHLVVICITVLWVLQYCGLVGGHKQGGGGCVWANDDWTARCFYSSTMMTMMMMPMMMMTMMTMMMIELHCAYTSLSDSIKHFASLFLPPLQSLLRLLSRLLTDAWHS